MSDSSKYITKYIVQIGTRTTEYEYLSTAAYHYCLHKYETPGAVLRRMVNGKEKRWTKEVEKAIQNRIACNQFIEDYNIEPGMTIYTSLRSVSSSGMYRWIKVLVPSVSGGETRVGIANISYTLAKITGHPFKEGAIGVGGCGMDMGFSTVYNLGRLLWPEGTPKAHSTRNGEPDRDGGYALKQSWV